MTTPPACRFELLHTVLGKIIGENDRLRPDRYLHDPGGRRTQPDHHAAVARADRYVAAVLTATGIFIPVVEAASPTNFAGYVAWCAWLLAVALVLFRAGSVQRPM